jgi:hypothetical protein
MSNEFNPPDAAGVKSWLLRKGMTEANYQNAIKYAKEAGIPVGMFLRLLLQEGGLTQHGPRNPKNPNEPSGPGQLSHWAVKDVNRLVASGEAKPPWGRKLMGLEHRYTQQYALWGSAWYLHICHDMAATVARRAGLTPTPTQMWGIAIMCYTSGVGAIYKAVRKFGLASSLENPEVYVQYARGNHMNRYLPNSLRGVRESPVEYERLV